MEAFKALEAGVAAHYDLMGGLLDQLPAVQPSLEVGEAAVAYMSVWTAVLDEEATGGHSVPGVLHNARSLVRYLLEALETQVWWGAPLPTPHPTPTPPTHTPTHALAHTHTMHPFPAEPTPRASHLISRSRFRFRFPSPTRAMRHAGGRRFRCCRSVCPQCNGRDLLEVRRAGDPW